MASGGLPQRQPVQFGGSRVARFLLACFGWRVLFEGLPSKQGVLVVYPHTSNWDFLVMVLAKAAVGVPLRFWGKDKLFGLPLFGRWLRWIGGVPVMRTSPRGAVGQMVDQMTQARTADRLFWLGLSPEGTRKRIPGWRSGFYQTTLQADVPLGLVTLDYRLREVRALTFIRLSGDPDADFGRIAQVYDGVTAYIPAQAAPIRLLARDLPRTETTVK
jgi:1-acyl-sn-glycerol-3-phosphate acyltransferase